MQTEIMKVKGMTCMGCVNSVKNVLEKIRGLSSSEVSLEQGQVTIRYDAEMAGTAQFREAIEDAGFEVLN
jgi:copper chaperone